MPLDLHVLFLPYYTKSRKKIGIKALLFFKNQAPQKFQAPLVLRATFSLLYCAKNHLRAILQEKIVSKKIDQVILARTHLILGKTL